MQLASRLPPLKAVYWNLSTVQLSQQRSQSPWPAHAPLTQPCYVHVCVWDPRERRARTRDDWHEGDLDLQWHWSSGAQPGRTFSLRGVRRQWRAATITTASFSSSAQRVASFTSPFSPLDSCKQCEFLCLSLPLQAPDSAAELVSRDDDYPNIRLFVLLLVGEAALCWYGVLGVEELRSLSLCIWDMMTHNLVATILKLRYRAGIRLK